MDDLLYIVLTASASVAVTWKTLVPVATFWEIPAE